jgi:ATP-dependent Clp protease ATP-binding subunit ClpC
MPYAKLKKIAEDFYGAALALDAFVGEEKRRFIYRNLFFACVFLFALTVTAFGIEKMVGEIVTDLVIFTQLANRMYGLFLIALSASFVFSSFEALHRSYYFRGLKQVLHESTDQKNMQVSWEVASIMDETDDEDITGGFINSSYGQEMLYRLGISVEVFSNYEALRTPTVRADDFILEREKDVSLAGYARNIYKQDTSFRHFLAENNINEEQLARSAEWVTSIERRDARQRRWWSRDNLGRIPGLGKTWSYGPTYLLERYGHEITEDHIWQTALMTRHDEDDEVEDLEQILSRGRQANALLLTNDVLTARQRVAQLYYKIREGHALPTIEGKRVFMVDVESVLMVHKEKASFELSLSDILEQSLGAGNIILYVENFSTAIASAQIVGTDLVDLFMPYIESSGLQVVLGETQDSYNKLLAHDSRINKAFDVIQMKDIGQEGLLDLLEQRALQIERKTNVVFSIQALQKVGDLAERYFPTGVMPDKAFDLLEEFIPYAFLHSIEQVLQKDIELFVNKKINVPIGTPKKEEREKLLELEDFLHKRVVAQEEAVSVISKALRRARAGLADPKKPMGSFLFLGPTGVGKTETAKALAEAMFNDEDAMIRMDMSEFNSPEAVEELLGSFETGVHGRLEEMLREKQYGVLLLDEFEKADKAIHDLFLQILDEGHFTDSFGHGVNLKNHIIIATSNAGADLIWEWEKNKQKEEIEDQKEALVDHMIEKNIFKPELLNRFDDIVVFHTLSKVQISKIAKIHLEKFAKRMEEEHNIKVRITDNLVAHVAKKGYDPKFGGRPLERAILEEVEQILADEMLADRLHAGDTFEFTDDKLS